MLYLLLVTLLTACAALPAPDVQVVDKAVAVSCVQNPPLTPRFKTDAELKAMPDYELVITLLSERIQREIIESELGAALEACK
jgi:hypothetical protein